MHTYIATAVRAAIPAHRDNRQTGNNATPSNRSREREKQSTHFVPASAHKVQLPQTTPTLTSNDIAAETAARDKPRHWQAGSRRKPRSLFAAWVNGNRA